ncbi:MAG: hypothetical protein CTY15_07130 [Methylocystis sp.]|nr:MAG: hypothetical protein CTY15_07130 [Methylocystis sp.]
MLLTTSRDSDHRNHRSTVSFALGLFATFLSAFTPSMTETAVANGDTRTIYLHHAHTGEDIAATYLVGGQYDSRVLQQLNWFLRDWRRDEPTNMDPRLFDVVWEAYRHAGAGDQVINVVSAYRSPETNAMLRARSRAVAKYSQHMLGKAMDTTMPGMPMSQVREIGMRMQRGGVGYYPTANTPFVHLDVGNVRSWPRMSYDQLVRLFPDGKTVHLPTNGQPLARYEEARAEIEARANGAYVTAPRRNPFGGFFAALFGGGGGEEEDAEVAAPPPSTRKQWALAPRRGRGADAEVSSDGEEGGGAPEPTSRRGRNQIARAEADLPRGETTMSATGAVAVAPPSAARSVQTAAPPAGDETAQEAPQEEVKRTTRQARVPLPPAGRPASLDKPTPLDEKPAEVAGLEAGNARELRSSNEPAEEQAAESAAPRRFVKAPTPPRRPAALASRAAEEPAQQAAEDKDNAPLAYSAPDGRSAEAKEASAEKRDERTVAEKGEFVPARLDRSNFNALTAATPTSRSSAKSVMGAPIAPVRSAARATDPNMLLPPARPARLVGFTPNASPSSDKFAPGGSRAPAQKNDPKAKK